MTTVNWDQIADTLGERLYQYFGRRGFQALASDLTQETLIRLYEKVESGQFDTKLGNFNQYAFGIARYVVFEHLFELQPHEDIENHTLVDSQQLSENLEQEQKSKHVRRAMASLSVAQQEVLSLVLDEELRLEEISELLNMPVGTVKSHVSRSGCHGRRGLLWDFFSVQDSFTKRNRNGFRMWRP
ncbi:MAG: RNA polymerase sigma factor [Bdellovibrionales bacterium]